MTTYKESGVDIEKASSFVETIKEYANKTKSPAQILSSIGGFQAAFRLPKGYEDPIIVTGTDGVGTKLKLANKIGIHDTIGIDLVAMCVNDILCCGADPLVFLDYYSSNKLDPKIGREIISGITMGCNFSGCALVGGETAELPNTYFNDEYELVGFVIGVVDAQKAITGKDIMPGDALIGISSSGFHSNGYSLINKVIKEKNINLEQEIDSKPLYEALLTPTRIYFKLIKKLKEQFPIKGISHITGGGLIDNPPRMIPGTLSPVIEQIKYPPLFKWIQEEAQLDDYEMRKTFNCGIGLVLCVDASSTHDIINFINEDTYENAYDIGYIGVGK